MRYIKAWFSITFEAPTATVKANIFTNQLFLVCKL